MKKKPQQIKAEAKAYKAAHGARLSDKDAAIIGPILDGIAVRNGLVTAQAVVDEAKDPASPLHPFFDWNDETAAAKWRLEHARSLIRSITIVLVGGKDSVETKSFQPVVQDAQRGYARAEDVFASVDLSQQVIGTAMRELRGWTKRYEQYRKAAALKDIFAAIDRAVEASEPVAAE